MIQPFLFVAPTAAMGRGVFTSAYIKANKIIEIAPVIVVSTADRVKLEQTLLHDYIFEWGPRKKKCCMALGYVSLYNHSYNSNCEYEMDFETAIITIKTVKPVHAGDELYINYNGKKDDQTQVWFDDKK